MLKAARSYSFVWTKHCDVIDGQTDGRTDTDSQPVDADAL